MVTLRLIFGTLALTLASTSCLRQKTPARVFIPPPARAQSPLPDPPGPLPDAPQLAADLASLVPPSLPGIAAELNSGLPEAPRRVARRPPTHVDLPKPPVNSTGSVTPESPAAPRLAQMFTPEELRQNIRTLEESLERVNRALTIVEGKNLTSEQKEIAERIRTFRKQAEQAREQDLLTAVSLAKRADLLAKDLLERLP